VIEDEDPRPGGEPFGQDHLLLVAAREVEAEGLDPGRADAQPVDPSPGDAPLRPDVDEASALELGQTRERDVRGDAQEQDQAFGPALARDVADAAIRGHGGRSEARLSAVHDEPTGVVRREAGERAGQLLAAGADHAGDAQDLAGVELEAHVAVGARQPESLGREHDLVPVRALQRLPVVLGLQPTTDHQPVQGVDVGARGGKLGHDRAVLHHVDAVGKLQHLVEAMRHEHERGTVP
jgi:hypothetical protein